MKIEALTLTAKLGDATITVTRPDMSGPPVATLQQGEAAPIQASLFFGDALEGFTEAQRRVAFWLADALSVANQSLAFSKGLAREIEAVRERQQQGTSP